VKGDVRVEAGCDGDRVVGSCPNEECTYRLGWCYGEKKKTWW
jgi:hypothetical protein